MKKAKSINIFEQKQVRTHWDLKKERWYISVIDAIEVLTGIDRPRSFIKNTIKTKKLFQENIKIRIKKWD